MSTIGTTRRQLRTRQEQPQGDQGETDQQPGQRTLGHGRELLIGQRDRAGDADMRLAGFHEGQLRRGGTNRIGGGATRLQRATPRAMVQYGLYCWTLFVAVTIGASWLMYFIRH